MNTQRTTQFLMANLGVEIIRLFGYKKQGKIKEARTSGERASKIIDSLESHPDINGGKKEVELMKDIIKDAVLKRPRHHVTEKELNSYFMPFSLRALTENGVIGLKLAL